MKQPYQRKCTLARINENNIPVPMGDEHGKGVHEEVRKDNNNSIASNKTTVDNNFRVEVPASFGALTSCLGLSGQFVEGGPLSPAASVDPPPLPETHEAPAKGPGSSCGKLLDPDSPTPTPKNWAEEVWKALANASRPLQLALVLCGISGQLEIATILCFLDELGVSPDGGCKLSSNEMQKAFDILSRHCITDKIATRFVERFQLSGSPIYVTNMKEKVKQKFYKKACQLATWLGIYVAGFIVPLVLGGHDGSVENYLKVTQPEQRKHAVHEIGELENKSTEWLESMAKACGIKKLRATPKSITKLCERLGIPLKGCAAQRGGDAVQVVKERDHVMKAKFRRRILLDDFIYFMQRILQHIFMISDADFMEESLAELKKQGAFDTSFELKKRLLGDAGAVCGDDDGNPTLDDPTWLADFRQPWEASDSYLQLPPDIEIDMIDNEEKLSDLCRTLQADEGPFGVDAEWLPLNLPGYNRCSILQLATRSRVYVLDLLLLDAESPAVTEAMETIFDVNKVILGYAFNNDVKMLQNFISTEKMKEGLKGVRDLSIGEVQEGGCSGFVKRRLDKPLDKSEQVSNWERRPLRPSQLVYAAIDAYCLIAVYDAQNRPTN